MQNTHHGVSSASGRQQVLQSSLIYLSIYFLYFIRWFHSSRAMLRQSSVQDKKGKKWHSERKQQWQTASAGGNQIILWRPSLLVIDVGPLQEVRWRSFLKHSIWRITRNPVFTLALDEQHFFCKNVDGKWGHQWRILREGFGRGRSSESNTISEK